MITSVGAIDRVPAGEAPTLATQVPLDLSQRRAGFSAPARPSAGSARARALLGDSSVRYEADTAGARAGAAGTCSCRSTWQISGDRCAAHTPRHTPSSAPAGFPARPVKRRGFNSSYTTSATRCRAENPLISCPHAPKLPRNSDLKLIPTTQAAPPRKLQGRGPPNASIPQR